MQYIEYEEEDPDRIKSSYRSMLEDDGVNPAEQGFMSGYSQEEEE